MKDLEAKLVIRMTRNLLFISIFVLLWAGITSCQTTDQNEISGAPTETAALSTPIASVSASEPATPLIILIAGANTDANLVTEVELILSEFGAQNGLALEKRETLNSAELPEGLRIVVVLSLEAGIAELAAAAPQVQFVTIDLPDIQVGGNISALSSGKPEHLGFIAGYTAAIITEDWRVGVISTSDTNEGQLIRESFIIGVQYFCGLCLQNYPPYYNYPLFAEQPSGSSTDQWRAAADRLLTSAVTTVYVAPGAGDDSLLEYLAQAGVLIIGSTTPPDQVRSNWVTTIGTDLHTELKETLARVLRGEEGDSIPLPIGFQFVNSELLSIGKLANVERLQIDLILGFILPLKP